jgi:hypothetical protein
MNGAMVIAASDFWKNFWPNFAANFVTGVFLTGLIGWIIKRRQRVDLAMGATLRVLPTGSTRAYFSIINNGNVVMRKDDGHFHVFVRERQIPLNVLNKLTCRRVKYLNGTYAEIKGTLNSSVFPSNATWVEGY